MERCRRLRRDQDFQRVRRQGRCWSSDVLVLCALPTEASLTRFGFVVGKRLGGAVVRNRVKRRLREAARRLAPSLQPGYDIVVIARGPVATRSSTELMTTLTGLARRAKLWREIGEMTPPVDASETSAGEGRQARTDAAGGQQL